MDILTDNKKMTCPRGSNARVAMHVIDTGVNEHGPLIGRVTTVRFADVAGDTTRTLGGGTKLDYSDRYGDKGHGTGVAYHACYGIPNAHVLSYNNQVGATNAALTAVLRYVKTHPEEQHIVNMSFKSGADEEMHRLIQQLVLLNVAVVVSAGNDGREAMDIYPSCYEEPFTVAAIKNDGSKAPFSVWHNEVDFAEIGVNIPTLTKDGDMEPMSGTSFSAPILCNKLGKIWSANPQLTEPQLYEQAKKNCLDLGVAGKDEYYGWGWIQSVQVAASPVPTPEPEPGPEPGPVVAVDRLLYLTSPRMSGTDVYKLEQQLGHLGYDCKMSSTEHAQRIGIFGPSCDAAVRAFQVDHKVDVYGKVGPFTRQALSKAELPPATLSEQLALWVQTKVGGIYVWGAQNDNLTTMRDERGRTLSAKTPEIWIRGMEDDDNDYARALTLYRKRVAEGKTPILAFDCSGLIVSWLHEVKLLSYDDDMSSRSLHSACTVITRAQLKPGCLVFRHNSTRIHHVGVYVGNGKVVEVVGRNDGVVIRDINADGSTYWNRYGSLKMLG